jgi:hypothetical protein
MRHAACRPTAMVVFLLLSTLLGSRLAGAQSPVIIKLATLAPDGSAWMQVL